MIAHRSQVLHLPPAMQLQTPAAYSPPEEAFECLCRMVYEIPKVPRLFPAHLSSKSASDSASLSLHAISHEGRGWHRLVAVSTCCAARVRWKKR